MTQREDIFRTLVADFSNLSEVEAIVLGGSRAKDSFDESSDYDLYIYVNQPISLEKRKQILDKHCSYIELNNQFWETEDDCTLENGVDIDILYRSLPGITTQVEDVKNGLAYNGYTTCIWANIVDSKILYDPEDSFKELQESLKIPYPEQLQKNIVLKNLRLLSDNLPSYDRQIKKAVSRNDLPSICHRTAAYLESYFDILFAMNKMLHPGEKRMMEKLRKAEILPVDFEKNLKLLFKNQYTDQEKFLQTLDEITNNIKELAIEQGYFE